VDGARVRAVIRGALAEVDRLESLLDEFRSPAGLQTFEFVVGDLVTVVEEVVALQALACQTDGVTVQCEFERHVPWVRLNPAKITQVVLNLCKNAIEAMPQGGCLTIKIYRSDASVTLAISDNGVGFPDSVKTLKGLTTTKGGARGMGLVIVQQIVAAHDAAITFSSEAGRRTTFKIDFPFTD
jgi:signal transduction histidine kinase